MNGLIDTIKKTFPPMHPAGTPFVLVFAIVTLLLLLLWQPLGWLGVALTVWCVTFFRDPKRVTPLDPDLLIAGADGRVSWVGSAMPPQELGLGDVPLNRISIFMSVFDVHINRAPVAGRIERIVYTPGKFLNAELDKASEHNERNAFIVSSSGRTYGLVQIAGLIARRILPFAREGQEVVAGERLGLIRFGSRFDIYLPDDVEPLVGEGQRCVAGETVIARIKPAGAPEPRARKFRTA